LAVRNCRLRKPIAPDKARFSGRRPGARENSAKRANPATASLAHSRGKDDIPVAASATFHIRSRFQQLNTMTEDDARELENELARLQQEHRDLDAAIDALHQSPAPDLLRLQRLKKRKLLLRDRIAFIEDQITPDIIA
jgi:hypothetical protein